MGGGSNCVLLQEECSEWNGNKYVFAVNSGTAALHMCLARFDMHPGDEVLVTTTSWISSATSIICHNAIPVFVNIDFDIILIDLKKIERYITSKSKAIIVVYYWGLTCNV